MTPEAERDEVDFLRLAALVYEPPLAPFVETDFRGHDAPADRRTEHQVRIVVADATADHHAHDAGRHPFCWPCEATARLFGNPPGDPPARARRFLLQPRGVPRAELTGEGRSPFLTLAELRALPPAEWLVEGVLPQGSVGYVTGRDQSFKSFLALDVVLHLVTSRDWCGRPLDFSGHGSALYVVGEGVRSFARRIDAWAAHHGPLAPWQESKLRLRDGAVDLFGGNGAYTSLLAAVRELRPDLVVVDTLARSAGAAEQNSASDMSVVTARLAELRTAGGDHCSVLVVAHTGKADDDTRGSSAIEDDADFVLHCKRDEDRLRVKIAKQKDGPDGLDIELQAVPVAESLVLVPARPEPTWLSDVLTERIKGALFAVRGQDDPTGAQLLALVRDDGTGKDVGRTGLYEALGALVRSGAVTVNENGAGRAKRYRLDPAQYPRDVLP